jgi:hypothetical protein
VCWKPCSSCWSFHLLREEFLSAPIHSPPLWFAVSVLQVVPEPVWVFIDSNQSKIQGWRTRNGVRPPHFDGKNYQMWSKRIGAFLRGRVRSFGMSQWTQAMSSRWTSSLQDRGTDSTPTTRRSTTCFVLCVSLSSIGCTPSTWHVGFGRC